MIKTILILILLSVHSFAYYEPIKICNKPDPKKDRIVNVDSGCDIKDTDRLFSQANYKQLINSINIKKFPSFQNLTLIIARDPDYKLDEVAFKCKVTIKRIITRETFWGSLEKQEPVIFSQDTTPEECNAMVRNKLCNKRKMICESNKCSFSQILESELRYDWLKDNNNDFTLCETEQIYIKSKTLDDILFNDPACLIKKGSCIHNSATYVWDTKDFNKCPYQNVGIFTNFIIHENDVVTINNYHLGFKLTNIIIKDIHCGTFIKATNGLLLALYDNRTHTFIKNTKTDNVELREIEIAEEDATKEDLFESIKKNQEIHCLKTQDQLNNCRDRINQFCKINLKNKKMILYSLNEILYTSKCKDYHLNVDELYVKDNYLVHGYKIANSTKIILYLHTNMILSDVKPNNVEVEIYRFFPSLNKKIHFRKNNTKVIEEHEKPITIEELIIDNSINISYRHSEMLLQESETDKRLFISSNHETNEELDSYIQGPTVEVGEYGIVKSFKSISSYFQNIKYWIYAIIIVVVVIGLLIVIVMLLYYLKGIFRR